MAVTITTADVRVFAPDIDEGRAQALIDGTLARAAQIAPCITDPGFRYSNAAKAILVDVIMRRHEVGAGSLHMQQAGPFQQSVDTRTSPRTLFWPAEIVELQRLCEAAKATMSTPALPVGKFPAPYDLPVTAPLSESPHYSVWPR